MVPASEVPLPHPFGELLDALPDGIVVTGADGFIIAVNQQLCALSGYERESLVGSPIEMLVPTRFGAEHVAQRTEYIQAGGPRRAMSGRPDIVLVRKDKREIPVDIALSSTGSGDQFVVVASVHDASSRREAQLARERDYGFLAAMNEITGALFAEGEIVQTLRAITAQARRLVGADLALFTVPDRDGEHLLFKVADGHGAAELEGTSIPVETSMSGLVMREHHPTLIVDASSDPRVHWPPSWPKDIGPALFLPLHARGETLGSLTIANRHGGSMFTADDVTMMKAFAAQGTIAILDARNQVRLRSVEVLEDRDRVAVAMRDGVINRISGVSLTLHTVLEGQLPEAASSRLWDAVEELDTAIRSIRDALFPR